MSMRDDESVEVSLQSSRSITLGSGAESNPTTGDLEQLSEEEAPSASSSDKKKKSQKKKLVVLAFLLIAALVAAIGVGVGSSSNSSANTSTSTAALGEFVTYDESSSSSKSAKSGTSKSSYSGSAKSGKSLTKSPTLRPTADPTRSPTTFCPVGSIDEGEGCRDSYPDNFNGGCLGSGFTNITFGESICGTVSNGISYLGILERDSDWYYFKVSTETTVSVRLTTDFAADLYLDRLGDGASCPATTVASGINVGDNTYVISSEVLQPGDYTIFVSSQSAGDPSLFCFTPGSYTLTLTDGPVP